MRARIGTVMKLSRSGTGMHYTPTPTEEIDICLNCPLPDCKKDRCARFAEEVKKIPRRRRRKR